MSDNSFAGYILIGGMIFPLSSIEADTLTVASNGSQIPKSGYQEVPDDKKQVALGWLAGQQGQDNLKEMYGSGLPIWEPTE